MAVMMVGVTSSAPCSTSFLNGMGRWAVTATRTAKLRSARMTSARQAIGAKVRGPRLTGAGVQAEGMPCLE
eukprot:CAMPEP_0168374364 /NCGR_PEP_ID=MMETSP0228-20121227/9263_1 /TAXON_ID=133427 /ORGANISM="Protoceratium reticulatum, Strain CCCM 535 (=CCMP 1889)" /LENGTH=70 /DNA_ID=CAMNT_0008387309 /DNA_START=150 /DNA_END=359 /DNA_ORIENTATION=-